MPADEFRTELRDSLTDFYEKILQRAGAGGSPVAKPLIHKFVAKAAPLSEDAPAVGADNVEAPLAAAAAAAAAAEAAPGDDAPPSLPAPDKAGPQTPPRQIREGQGRQLSTSVRTGLYQYIPPCTTLYQGYRIPDVLKSIGYKRALESLTLLTILCVVLLHV